MRLFPHYIAAAAIAAGLVTATAAQAHGIWFAQRARQTALIYGIGSDDLDAVKRLPLVKSVGGYDAQWKPVATSLREAGVIPLVDSEAPTTAITAVMDNGIWSKDKAGEWHKMGRDEMPDATISERTFKYAVHLTGAMSSPLPAFPDQKLQLVPADAQIPAEMGKPITLRVLFDGKPVKGAKIKADFVNDPDQVPLETDANGMVTLPIRNQGLNVIAAIYVGPSDQPKKYDHIEHLATLSFVLPHAPE